MKLHFFRGRPAAALKTLNLARAAGRVARGFCSVARVARWVNTIVAGHGPRGVARNSRPCGAWPVIRGQGQGHGSWVMGQGQGQEPRAKGHGQGSWPRVSVPTIP